MRVSTRALIRLSQLPGWLAQLPASGTKANPKAKERSAHRPATSSARRHRPRTGPDPGASVAISQQGISKASLMNIRAAQTQNLKTHQLVLDQRFFCGHHMCLDKP
jgi:hypothetical protein